MRHILTEDKVESTALNAMNSFHKDIVQSVEKAVQKNKWVIIGMRQNPVVKSARKFLEEKSIAFEYMEYGSYLSMWKQRLAIKLWSGWPTYPQIFHNGKLVGGFSELKKYSGVNA